MNQQFKEAAEREFPFDSYETQLERSAYIKACEHMESAASELVRALERIRNLPTTKFYRWNIQEIADQALSAYPKQEEGKEAKDVDPDFTLWVVVNRWQYNQDTHKWHNKYIVEFEDYYLRHDELYQLFKQKPQP